MTLVLLVHLAATLFMTGIIWFVQIVHYPLFGKVGATGYGAYANAHAQRTTWVVGPPMLTELATAGLLVAWRPAQVMEWQAWVGLGLVGVLWASTAGLQVPQHNVLEKGYDPEAHRRLVATNWLRTACWSLRSVLVCWMTYASLQA